MAARVHARALGAHGAGRGVRGRGGGRGVGAGAAVPVARAARAGRRRRAARLLRRHTVLTPVGIPSLCTLITIITLYIHLEF